MGCFCKAMRETWNDQVPRELAMLERRDNILKQEEV
jgi:hypothetical protein